MDKLPKLRRKPKPPTIETSIVRPRRDESQERPASASSSGTTTSIQALAPKPSMRRSPLQSLRLRVSAKRARTNSPAAHPSSSPVAAVFSQDAQHRTSANRAPRPQMPAFLNSSPQDIDQKFQELVWAERGRLAQGARPDAPPDCKWKSFKQTDVAQRGLMDRYMNIKPWNHNRVKLRVADAAFDYVNASAIALASDDGSQQYIAMQGPTVPSFTYVWRMVAEQTASPAVIIQLTPMIEANAIKCHQYFPVDSDEGPWMLNDDEDVWNDGWKAKLAYQSGEELANGAIEKRKLLLHVAGENEPRVVWHFLYTRWPDFGAPSLDDIDSFFELMRLSREHNDGTHPRIVHCSAGVGRTGTFITLEHLVGQLEGGMFERYDGQAGDDPIYRIVDTLRQQRRCMVQSEVQYQFIYDVMRKLWLDKYGEEGEAEREREREREREPAAKRLEVEHNDDVSDNGE